MEQNKEIKALLALLDDTDDVVRTSVEKRIIEIGKDVIPSLENYWEQVKDEIIQDRIEDLIRSLNFKDVLNSFENWVKDEDQDLFEVMLLACKYRFTTIDERLLVTK